MKIIVSTKDANYVDSTEKLGDWDVEEGKGFAEFAEVAAKATQYMNEAGALQGVPERKIVGVILVFDKKGVA